MDEGKRLKKFLLTVIAVISVIIVFASAFVFLVNKAPPQGFVQSSLSTRLWVNLRLGQEFHFEVQNKTSRSFMMIALCGTKSHVFTISPASHSVYTPQFRVFKRQLEKGGVIVQLRFLDEQSTLSASPSEAYVPLSVSDGSLSSYCAYGDFLGELTILEAEDGAFKVEYSSFK